MTNTAAHGPAARLAPEEERGGGAGGGAGGGGVTMEFTFHHSKGQRGQRQIHNGKPPKPTSPGRVPRISRLMALAIRFDGLIAEGQLTGYADIALWDM